jgi:hypothetical protein
MNINIILMTIIILLLPYIYYKLKYKFWSSQPVFHYHNLWYWLFPPGIIQHKIPDRNKFFNPEIQFDTFNLLKTEKKALFTSFIKSHFLPKKFEQYKPTSKNITDYFENHNNPSYISLFLKQINATKRILLGVITTTPMECLIDNKLLNVYYADNICVHPNYRHKGIAPQLIYSHYLNHRMKNKNTVFLFKKEGIKTMIVPITAYKNYGFKITFWQKNIYFDQPNFEILMIKDGNFNKIIDIMEHLNKHFDCVIKPNINHIKYLCKVGNLIITTVLIDKKPVALYFFKNPHVFYNDKKSIEFIGSYSETTNDIFILGGLISIDKVYKMMKNDILFIENISNNNIIIKMLLSKYNAFVESDTSYYFYNFAYRPFISTSVFCID